MSSTINTYDGPGPARKGCPNGHYVHVKQGTCVCGHIFTREPKARIERIKRDPEPKEVQTYDESGKGRKQCPGCNKYVGGRVEKCACGFDFKNYQAPDKEKEVKVYDEGGGGRKQCPCGKFVGARVSKCPVCQHEFIAGESKQKEINCEKKEEEGEVRELSYAARLGYPGFAVTYTPAGECPFRLYTAEYSDVVDWIKKVHNYYLERRQVLAPSGFSYYARDFFDVFSPQYNSIKRTIKSYFEPYTK